MEKIWLGYPLFIVFILAILIIGAYSFPLRDTVDPEYLNGLLAGQSLFFGFWTVILSTKYKSTTEEFYQKHLFLKNFYICFGSLIATGIALFYLRSDPKYSIRAFFVLFTSFIYHAYFVLATIRTKKFMRTSKKMTHAISSF